MCILIYVYMKLGNKKAELVEKYVWKWNSKSFSIETLA